MCFFAARKWLKSRRNKAKLLNTEISNEKPVDPAIAAVNRRIKKRVIWSTSFAMVSGIILLILILWWLGFSWRVGWLIVLPNLLIWLLCMGMGARWRYKNSMQRREGKR